MNSPVPQGKNSPAGDNAVACERLMQQAMQVSDLVRVRAAPLAGSGQAAVAARQEIQSLLQELADLSIAHRGFRVSLPPGAPHSIPDRITVLTGEICHHVDTESLAEADRILMMLHQKIPAGTQLQAPLAAHPPETADAARGTVY